MANRGIFDNRIVNGIAILVSLVWAISFVADILIAGYDPSPFIHLAMMTIVGAAVGRGFIRNGNGNGNGNS
jgi:hypothetical protein